MPAEILIDIDYVSKQYALASGAFTVLHHISFQIPKGQLVAIVGKSGSGKSTLLNMLSGIDHPSEGTVVIDGTNVHSLNESRLASWRGAMIGIVFQFFQLIPTLNILENVLLAMDFVNVVAKNNRHERAHHLLELVGIADHADKFPSALSGGEQQRAAIARALANDPPILIADEPTGNLDSQTTDDIQHVFSELANNGKTIIVVTHDDITDVGYERMLTLKDGHLVGEKLFA